MAGDLVTGILGGVGALFGGLGQDSQNRANAAMASDQRNFEQEMSNTAYQRSKADMEKAGLNPLMMYGSGSSASTPVGASAQAGNIGAASMSSAGAAVDMANKSGQNDLMASQKAKADAETQGQLIENKAKGKWAPANDAAGKAINAITNTIIKNYNQGSSAYQNFKQGGAENSPEARAARLRQLNNSNNFSMQPGDHPSNQQSGAQ